LLLIIDLGHRCHTFFFPSPGSMDSSAVAILPSHLLLANMTKTIFEIQFHI